nr:hypothetical protein Iba_chr03aCG0930 [Ipomoea batatas]
MVCSCGYDDELTWSLSQDGDAGKQWQSGAEGSYSCMLYKWIATGASKSCGDWININITGKGVCSAGPLLEEGVVLFSTTIWWLLEMKE